VGGRFRCLTKATKSCAIYLPARSSAAKKSSAIPLVLMSSRLFFNAICLRRCGKINYPKEEPCKKRVHVQDAPFNPAGGMSAKCPHGVAQSPGR